MKIVKSGFGIIVNTLSGLEIGCFGDDENEKRTPEIFETEVDAWKEIADTMVEILQQFIDGERKLEDTDFSTEESVVWMEIDDEDFVRCYSYEYVDGKMRKQSFFSEDCPPIHVAKLEHA